MEFIPTDTLINAKVISFWLKKYAWTHEEFSALYCGINPFAIDEDARWEDRKLIGPSLESDKTYKLKVSSEQHKKIADLMTLIRHRLEPFEIHKTPAGWKSALRRLDLPTPSWMDVIKLDTSETLVQQKIREEKPLNSKEKDSLLIIIAALCNHAGFKPSDRGVSVKIKEQVEQMGVKIDEDTVRKWLKLIPDVLEKREK
jgi:hypothetical protein